MAEKIYEERKKIYPLLALFLLICGFFVLPNIHTVPCSSWCIEPDSLVYLIIGLWGATPLFTLLYFIDAKKYKIIGKKYLYEGEEEQKEPQTKEIWTELK